MNLIDYCREKKIIELINFNNNINNEINDKDDDDNNDNNNEICIQGPKCK